MPEWLQVLLAVGGVLTPVVLAAMARDRTLLGMINRVRDDTITLVSSQTAPLHERINRVRDEYVRRDDLQAHLVGIEKRFDDLRAELRRSSETTDRKLDEIQKTLRAGAK